MKNKLLEMFPYGIAYGFTGARPVMLFRDENNRHVLPVWVSAIEADIVNSIRSPRDYLHSPHQPSGDLLAQMDLKLVSCVFHEMKGTTLFCQLRYKSSGEQEWLSEIKAENAMSFCLSQEARFFSTPEVIQACRQVQADHSEGPIGEVRGFGKTEKHKQKYMNQH